jgi:hypothetical protein
MFEIGQCDDVDHPTQMHLYCATEKILKAMGYRVEVGGRGCQRIFLNCEGSVFSECKSPALSGTYMIWR